MSVRVDVAFNDSSSSFVNQKQQLSSFYFPVFVIVSYNIPNTCRLGDWENVNDSIAGEHVV